MAATTNSSAHSNGGTTDGSTPPSIVFYNSRRCPWANRAHLTLLELGLPFEEKLINLDTPRPQWYLDINPRGLVPSIKYSVPGVLDNEIITESGTVAQFLMDSFPSHLYPASRASPTAPLERARMSWFVDTFFSKLGSQQLATMKAPAEEKSARVEEWIAVVEKELEPHLKNAKPFFGGSEEFTYVEVMTAPFILRWYAFATDGEVVPSSLIEGLDKLPNFSKWAKAIRERKSVLTIWDEESVVQGFKAKYGDKFNKV